MKQGTRRTHSGGGRTMGQKYRHVEQGVMSYEEERNADAGAQGTAWLLQRLQTFHGKERPDIAPRSKRKKG